MCRRCCANGLLHSLGPPKDIIDGDGFFNDDLICDDDDVLM